MPASASSSVLNGDVKEDVASLEPISKSHLFTIGPLVVIPAQAGIQFFRAFLDARFREHDSFSTGSQF